MRTSETRFRCLMGPATRRWLARRSEGFFLALQSIPTTQGFAIVAPGFYSTNSIAQERFGHKFERKAKEIQPGFERPPIEAMRRRDDSVPLIGGLGEKHLSRNPTCHHVLTQETYGRAGKILLCTNLPVNLLSRSICGIRSNRLERKFFSDTSKLEEKCIFLALTRLKTREHF